MKKDKIKELKYLYLHEDYTAQNINQKVNDKYQYIKNWIGYETHNKRQQQS